MTKNCIEFHQVAMERKKSLRTHSCGRVSVLVVCRVCVGQGGGRFTISTVS